MKLKRVVLIAIIFFYLMPLTGGAVRVYYCDGEFIGIDLGSQDKPECCCTEESDPECCQSTIISLVKINESQNTVKRFASPGASIKETFRILFHVKGYALINDWIRSKNVQYFLESPDLKPTPLYVLNAVFLI